MREKEGILLFLNRPNENPKLGFVFLSWTDSHGAPAFGEISWENKPFVFLVSCFNLKLYMTKY